MFLCRAPHLPRASGQIDEYNLFTVPEGGGFHVVPTTETATGPADLNGKPCLAQNPLRLVGPGNNPVIRLRLEKESKEAKLPVEPRRPHVEVAPRVRRLGNRICLLGFPPSPS